MSLKIDIHLDKLLIKLLCGYVFLIPLEQVLEVLFGIDTVFKPYRVFAIIIIGLFVIRSQYRWKGNEEIAQDIFLFAIFIYGVMVTLFRFVTTQFSLGFFYNDAFQISLYFGVFLVIRHLYMEGRDMQMLMKWLFAGVFVNGLFVFNSFFILRQYRREGGLMDNPNYLALSLVFAICFLIIQLPNIKGLFRRLLWLAALLFLGYIFVLAGSRTGLLILAVGIAIILLSAPIRIKSRLIAVGLLILVMLSIGGASVVRNTGPLVLINRLQKESASDNRVAIWEGALEAAKVSSYAGLGIGQFKNRFSEFYHDVNNPLISRILQRDYFLSPHSDYLAILIVYGIVGLLSYLIFLFLSLRKVWGAFRSSSEPFFKRHYQLCLIMLSSLTLFGITQESLISPIFWILLSISTRVVLEPSATTQIPNETLILDS